MNGALLPLPADDFATFTQSALSRIVSPAAAAGISIEQLPPRSGDAYELRPSATGPVIAATTPAAALRGLRELLGLEGRGFDEMLSWAGDRPVPNPPGIIRREAGFPHRYWGNDCEDGYTGPYRDADAWARQLDALAGAGYREVFIPTGTEAVYLEVLMGWGYSRDEVLAWIPLPSHQPWWLLQNMAGYPSGLTAELVERRREVGARTVARARELGLVPVLPGFGGMVPREFAHRNPGANVIVAEHDWQGFERPGWLDTTTTEFQTLAAAFYAAQERLLGRAEMFKTDLLHEGGEIGGVDEADAARGVQAAMQAARPGAVWVMLGWQANPPAALLAGTDPRYTLVVDGISDRSPVRDRDQDFAGIDYAFGGIWNFGGDTAMGAPAATWSSRIPAWRDAQDSRLRGVAAIPEGSRNNPLALDLLAGLAWGAGGSLERQVLAWQHARYGHRHPDAEAAWRIIAATAYSLPENGFSEPHDSLIHAWPSLDVRTSSQWSPDTATYDLDEFATALPRLLAAADRLGQHPAFRFDLADVSRQVLANTTRTLLPAIAASHADQDWDRYDTLVTLWDRVLAHLDAVTGTQPAWLLGRFLDEARRMASTDAEADACERSARLILTSWGPQRPAVDGQLSAYAGREWQGLIATLYAPRWREFFTAVRDDDPAALTPADWWQRDLGWIVSTDRTGIRSLPEGDITRLAAEALTLLADVRTAVE